MPVPRSGPSRAAAPGPSARLRERAWRPADMLATSPLKLTPQVCLDPRAMFAWSPLTPTDGSAGPAEPGTPHISRFGVEPEPAFYRRCRGGAQTRRSPAAARGRGRLGPRGLGCPGLRPGPTEAGWSPGTQPGGEPGRRGGAELTLCRAWRGRIGSCHLLETAGGQRLPGTDGHALMGARDCLLGPHVPATLRSQVRAGPCPPPPRR